MKLKTRSIIIAELYNSKHVASALAKMQPAEIRGDLKQEIFLAICAISEEKFWSIYNNNGINGLRFWIIRCMLNMVYSHKPTDSFYRHFRMKLESFENFNNIAEIEDNSKEVKEFFYNKIETNRSQLSWYERKMLDIYIELGYNQTEVSRRTKIPYQSVVKTIFSIKKKLKE